MKVSLSKTYLAGTAVTINQSKINPCVSVVEAQFILRLQFKCTYPLLIVLIASFKFLDFLHIIPSYAQKIGTLKNENIVC